MNSEIKTAFDVLAVGLVLGVGITLGSYTIAALWTVLKNTWKKRNAAADLARVAEIEAQWRKMPNRDRRGRFSKKSG